MPRYKIICEDCNIHFIAFWNNTKLCELCRIIRDLQYMSSLKKAKKTTCVVCEEDFYPIRTTHKICYNCNLTLRDRADAACNICSRHIKPAPGLTNTCVVCVSASPEARTKYLTTLLKRRTTLLDDEI